MKKMIGFGAVALCAAVACADVTSANVVGYYTTTLKAQQMNMLGVKFQDVGGGSISVQNLIPDPLGQGLSGAMMKGLAGQADQLCFWDMATKGKYVYLYLNNSATKRNKWCVYTSDADMSEAAKAFWGNSDVASTAKLQPGMGFWFKRAKFTSEKTITLSGQVTVAQDGLNMVLDPGMNMFTYGFTTPFAPNPDLAETGVAIDWLSKGCKGAMMKGLAGQADQLCFWDPSVKGKYVYLYLCNATGNKRNKWCVYTSDADMGATAKAFWGANDTATSAIVPSGLGCWYKRAGNTGFTLTLDQPYSL